MNVVKLKEIDITPKLDSIEADRMLIDQAASYIKNIWQQVNAAEMYIAAGREFKNLHGHLSKISKHDKGRIGWVRAFEKEENKFGCMRRTAEGSITIYDAFFHVGNVLPTWKLPQSFRALLLLAKSKPAADQLQSWIQDGLMNPNSTEGDVRRLIQKPKTKKKSKPNSLTVPSPNAPKRERIEAVLNLLKRLSLTINDLKKAAQ